MNMASDSFCFMQGHKFYVSQQTCSLNPSAEPHSSVGSVADLRAGGCWFDPWLGQYSVRGLMIVITTGFIPLSPLSVV